jgi:SAM-dependent methyltransferase
MDHYRKANLDRWNELVAIHAASAFYDLDAFRAGKCSLRSIEREELGDVSGKSLLHLQCHFGQDTLSWARRGAHVTGIDFSSEAIKLARDLNEELNLNARFICSELYDLPKVLDGKFDIVFTSYGAICWLPDLGEWARVIAHFLKAGGTFYIVEIHPFANVFAEDSDPAELKVGYPYFHAPTPLKWETPGTYADRDAVVKHGVSYDWVHSLGDVLNALIAAGLQIEFLHEFPFCVCGMLPCMEQSADGWWRVKGREDTIPFLFSLKATRRTHE